MTMTPVFVEFTGLPGSGKTTIGKAVLLELARMDYRCFSNGTLSNPETSIRPKEARRLFNKLETFNSLISSCITHKYVAANALMCALHTRPLSLVSFGRAADLLIRLNLIKKVMDDNYDLIIFDQGVIQYIWSIAATDKPPSDKYLIRLLKRILNEISLAIVLVDIDVDMAVERINNRPTTSSRFDRMSSNQAGKLLAKQRDFFKQFVNWSVELNDIRYLAVDGSHPIKKNSNTIIHFIEQTWQTQRN